MFFVLDFVDLNGFGGGIVEKYYIFDLNILEKIFFFVLLNK